MNRKHATALATLVSSIAALAGLARAADRKIYNATECKQVGSQGVVNRQDTGRIYNASADTLTVVCPVVRDKTDAAPRSDAWIYLDDNHPTSAIRCELRSIAATGSSYDHVDVSSTETSGPTTKYTFDSSSLRAYDNGRYVIVCTIPGRSGGVSSGIAAYSVHEEY